MFTSLPTRPLALGAAALTVALTLAVPAQAAREQQSQVAVRYSDLNLATADGRRVLEQRLDRAAREVCGTNERIVGSRMPTREASACYKETRTRLAEQFAQAVSADRRGG